jgi:hypothetical protein
MSDEPSSDDLRRFAKLGNPGWHVECIRRLEWAADRIDSDAEALSDLSHELKEETGVVIEQRAEIERLRAELLEYRGDPQCEAVGDVGAGVRCTRQAGHKGDHVGTLEEFWWTT